MCAWLPVCIFLHLPSAMQQALGNSHFTRSAITHSSPSTQQTMWGRDVTHPAMEPLLPLSLLPSFPLSPSPHLSCRSVCIPVICLCAWFSSLYWMTRESQWHHCPQAKTRLDEQRHAFLPLSLPRWLQLPSVWSYFIPPYHHRCLWKELLMETNHKKTINLC